ncbi:hypothetical protein ABS71_22020 [bacterium SCN 62-11]|nr:FMN-binding negative transcriptional regulator [Candidatus Eremiobacteraeota bacterium]ODT56289.1 MAG: hypothetical protein ABS71_22020 [bacterium SCN 62-11]
MYCPVAYQVQEVEELHHFLRVHPLGLLVSVTGEAAEANLIPFYLDADQGMLRGHLSKANGQRALAGQVLVVFQGPQAYVTPSWYASKQHHGKVVPTWNYSMVQVRGSARVVDDPEWLRRHVSELTDFFEQTQGQPWAVADAPEAYLQGQLKGIVGVEISMDSLQGKWKMSQNRSAEDRAGVAAGLRAQGREDAALLVEGRHHV